MPWRSHWESTTLRLSNTSVVVSGDIEIPFNTIEKFGYTTDGWVIFNHNDERLPKIIIVSGWGQTTYNLALALQSAGVHSDSRITKRTLVKHYAFLAVIIVAVILYFGSNYLSAHVINK